MNEELRALVIRWDGIVAAMRRQDPAAAEAVRLCMGELEEVLDKHEAFRCCGGSDEHPPEHTQDCTRASQPTKQVKL